MLKLSFLNSHSLSYFKCRQVKIWQGRWVKQGTSFHFISNFTSRFFYKAPKISAKIQKPINTSLNTC